MARQTPLPRFRLDTDSLPESRTTSLSPSASQRSQTRIRRSACSDLQNSTIPEERIYHDNRHRRASLFVGRTSQSKNSNDKQQTSEGDYIKLCRQRCQSLYKSLANKTTSKSNEQQQQQQQQQEHEEEKDEEEEEEEEEDIPFPPPSSSSRRNYRYSLPDASPAALALRNILKRNKTTKHNHVRIDLPSDSSSHSFSSALTSASPSSSSPISTFRNFLSLVKNKSSTPTTTTTTATTHHSSLTTLSNATGGSSTTLDQTIMLAIPPTMQWHFEVKSENSSNDSTSNCLTKTTFIKTKISIECHQRVEKELYTEKELISSIYTVMFT